MDRRIAPAVVTLAGMIATPLLPQGGRARRLLSTVVVTGLAATSGTAVHRRWGWSRTMVASATIATLTGVVEKVGTRTGVPFGSYDYTGSLRPEVAGVPAIVPLAWFAMAVPARETAHAALGERSSVARRIGLGAATLTAWDLFLDPQMVGEGYWKWVQRGRYRGIPASNFAGWFLTGLVVMALLERALPVGTSRGEGSEPGDGRGEWRGSALPADPTLVGVYAIMAVMETLGFAVFFRDRRVAAVGGAGMLPVAAAALARRAWRGR